MKIVIVIHLPWQMATAEMKIRYPYVFNTVYTDDELKKLKIQDDIRGRHALNTKTKVDGYTIVDDASFYSYLGNCSNKRHINYVNEMMYIHSMITYTDESGNELNKESHNPIRDLSQFYLRDLKFLDKI